MTRQRSAIVTGGGQGIGKGTAVHLLEAGWKVCAIDQDREALRDLAAEHPTDRLLTITCDVGKEPAVAGAFEKFTGWAAGELDLLVSNAGIADPYCGPIESLSLADWRKWQDSHVTGAFLMTRAGVPLLRKARGSIVFVASTRALQSEPETEAYSAAKGALVGLTHALAITLGPEIRVNAVLPGWIETGPWQKAGARRPANHSKADREQHPVGRVGEPGDIAGTIAFLASDAAGFITGQQIVVDGGMTVKMIYA